MVHLNWRPVQQTQAVIVGSCWVRLHIQRQHCWMLLSFARGFRSNEMRDKMLFFSVFRILYACWSFFLLCSISTLALSLIQIREQSNIGAIQNRFTQMISDNCWFRLLRKLVKCSCWSTVCPWANTLNKQPSIPLSRIWMTH